MPLRLVEHDVHRVVVAEHPEQELVIPLLLCVADVQIIVCLAFRAHVEANGEKRTILRVLGEECLHVVFGPFRVKPCGGRRPLPKPFHNVLKLDVTGMRWY